MASLKKKILNPKSLSLLLLAGVLGWFIVGQWEKTRTVTYVIPPGASQKLEAGEEIVDFPNEITLTIGVRDTIVIENQDDAVHAFGPFTILPHTTLTKRFKTPRVYESACTFHKDQQMKLVINPAPWDIFQ